MRGYWKTIIILAVVAAVALSVAAVAYGATRNTTRRAGNGVCGALMSNPKALKAMQQLRIEHQKDMQAWYEQYGSDPSGTEAQTALQQLREEHWSDMRNLFKKFGVKAPAGAGPGSGMMRRSGGCGGACGGAGGTATGAQGSGYGGGMMGGSGYGMMGASY